MSMRRVLLSAALVGGCLWCLGLVQQVQSQEGVGTERRPAAGEAPSARGDAQDQAGWPDRAEISRAADGGAVGPTG